MKLIISYAEFSFLRDLVKKEQLTIWKKKWLPQILKEAKNPEKEFEKIMNRDSIIWDSIATDEDCCNMLLRRFDESEKEFQKSLKCKS